MRKDFSNVNSNFELVNTSNETVRFDLRDDWKQMSIIVEPNSSTNVTVTSSEGIASLTQKAEILGLNLVPASSEPEEPDEPEYQKVWSVMKDCEYRFTFNDTPTKSLMEVMNDEELRNSAYGIAHIDRDNDEKVLVGLLSGDAIYGIVTSTISHPSPALVPSYCYLTDTELEFIRESGTVVGTGAGWYKYSGNGDTGLTATKVNKTPEPVTIIITDIMESTTGQSVSNGEAVDLSKMNYLFKSIEFIDSHMVV